MNRQYQNVLSTIGKRIFTVLILCSCAIVPDLQAASISLLLDDKSPQAVFAAEDIQVALKARGRSVKQLSLAQLSGIADGELIVLSIVQTRILTMPCSRKVQSLRGL